MYNKNNYHLRFYMNSFIFHLGTTISDSFIPSYDIQFPNNSVSLKLRTPFLQK